MEKIRIGTGYDIHRLVTGRPLMLGGVHIPFEKGLEGHSDADVLLHAITDAMLGAMAMGDIGYHFPDSDDQWEGVDSVLFMSEAYKKIEAEGYTICNIDATVIAEQPRLKDYIRKMRSIISIALKLDISDVSVKATTHETLGPIGSGEGIAAMASVLIQSTGK